MGFVSFMASGVGRLVRIVAGLALVAGGLALVFAVNNLVAGIIVIVVGLLPLLAGLFDFCVFAPLFRAPFLGVKIRSRE